MKVTVNDTPLMIHDGAMVKEAIIAWYSQTGRRLPKQLPAVSDRYGNPVDHEGRLTEGNTLYLKVRGRKRNSLLPLLAIILAAGATVAGCIGRSSSAPDRGWRRQAVILAVNDMHAAIDNFPKLAYLADSLRAIYPDLLLVGAGDNQTGNPVNEQYHEKGLPMIELMTATGFNLSAVGNHEFDTGPEGFARLSRKAGFPFVSANVAPHDSLDLRLSPCEVITLPNGLRLAFVGLTQVSASGIPDTRPANTEGFIFHSPFTTVKEYLWLRDSSDILIALTHLGFEDDVKLALETPPGIDLIIGGHSHTRVENEQVHNGILITQAENKLKYATLITLSVSRRGKISKSMQLISIPALKGEKPEIRAMVDRYNDNPVLNEVIAEATAGFASREQLGYLMADAQRDAAGADIALMNPGGVRLDQLPAGEVTLKHVYQLDPFGNELVVTRLTGNELLSLLRAAWPVDEEKALLPSGINIRIRFDEQRQPEEFAVTQSNGTPLDPERTYTVAMNSYMTEVYHYDHSDPGRSLFFTTAEALITYLKKESPLRSYGNEKRVFIN